jgi:hypothetical protein
MNNLLLATYGDGNTAWPSAAKSSYIAVTDELYEIAQTENEPTISFSLLQKKKNHITACYKEHASTKYRNLSAIKM